MIKFLKYLFNVFLSKSFIFDLIIKKNKLNYPLIIREEVKKIIKYLKIDKHRKINNKNYKIVDIYDYHNKENIIELASEKINFYDKNIYKKISYDLENVEALYRLSWVIKDLEKNNFTYSNYNINFVLENFEIKFKNLFYSPYTISERLINISLFCTITNLTLSRQSIKMFKNDVTYLLNNIEYNVHGYNNHLFKNFKALYISGLFTGDVNISNSFKKYIINIFDEFVDRDSFLNEGSSNYIILFYTWCYDILFFSKIYSDNEMYSFIISKINKMNEKIRIFFLIQINNESLFKIGDISPDYNFDFINSYIKFVINFTKEKKVSFNYSNKNDIDTDTSSWIRKDAYHSVILSRKIDLKKINYHEHNDFFHFIFTYKNDYIFIDSGNKNYNEDNKRLQYKSLSSHNSIIVDNIDYRNRWNLFLNNTNEYHTKPISKDKIDYIFKNNNSKINRIIKILPNGCIIKDNLILKKKSKYIEVTFQLNPNLKIESDGYDKYMVKINKIHFIFTIKSNCEFKTQIKENFYSSDYGLEEKKQYISVVFKNINNLNVKYILKEII